jgi:uncharacterized repeat protein (TIGR01451 family)
VFTITGRNSGNVALANVTVTDPRAPGCNRRLGALTPGRSKSYRCTRADVLTSFRNVATVTGKPPGGAQLVVNTSRRVLVKVAPFVVPANPGIAIDKSPRQQTLTIPAAGASPGHPSAHFRITVRNIGNVALHGVRVSDPLSPGCSRTLGTLAAGRSTSYSCRRQSVSTSFANVATASGISARGKKVEATDRAIVKVETPKAPPSFTG